MLFISRCVKWTTKTSHDGVCEQNGVLTYRGQEISRSPGGHGREFLSWIPSASERNAILVCAKTSVDLENTLSEINQTSTNIVTLWYEVPGVGRFTESRSGIARG